MSPCANMMRRQTRCEDTVSPRPMPATDMVPLPTALSNSSNMPRSIPHRRAARGRGRALGCCGRREPCGGSGGLAACRQEKATPRTAGRHCQPHGASDPAAAGKRAKGGPTTDPDELGKMLLIASAPTWLYSHARRAGHRQRQSISLLPKQTRKGTNKPTHQANKPNRQANGHTYEQPNERTN